MGPDQGALSKTSVGRYLVYAGPLVWAVLILFHPNPGGDSPYEGITDDVDRWLVVHVGQLILTPFLFLAVWRLLDGLSSAAARISRAALVVWTVFFTAYDSIQGSRPASSLVEPTTSRARSRPPWGGQSIRRRGQPARRKHFRDRTRRGRLLADRRDRSGHSPSQGRRREGRCRGNLPVGCGRCAQCPSGDWIFRALPRWNPS
jgi:hypothetical protein